jgi:hypothetical protein
MNIFLATARWILTILPAFLSGSAIGTPPAPSDTTSVANTDHVPNGHITTRFFSVLLFLTALIFAVSMLIKSGAVTFSIPFGDSAYVSSPR